MKLIAPFLTIALAFQLHAATLPAPIGITSELTPPTSGGQSRLNTPGNTKAPVGLFDGDPGSTVVNGNGSSFVVDPTQFGGSNTASVTLHISAANASIMNFVNGATGNNMGMAVENFSGTSGGYSSFTLTAASASGVTTFGLNDNPAATPVFRIIPKGGVDIDPTTGLLTRPVPLFIISTFPFNYDVTLPITGPTTFTLNYNPVTLIPNEILAAGGEDMTVTVASVTPTNLKPSGSLVVGGSVGQATAPVGKKVPVNWTISFN